MSAGSGTSAPTSDRADVARFAARYPRAHDYAGKLVERGRLCSHCNAKWFGQQLVDSEWLNSMQANSPLRLLAFLQSCEVEIDGDRKCAWLPARCHVCERRAVARSAAA